jgi:predicted RND superfamily exporter protein
MDALLGTYLTPTAILTNDSAHAQRVAQAIRADREAGLFGELVSSVRTIDDVLPRDQKDKLAVAADIREAMTPKLRSLLPEERRSTVERILDGANDQPITVNDVPRTFTTGLREKDGSFDKIVLVYPKPSKALWDGPALASFVTHLRDISARTASPGETPARVAGSLALSTDILESIRRDGPKASFAALAGVIVVVLLLFRFSVASLKIIGSLVVGVSWLVALTVLFKVKINFANFIAFPITFGIGVDYAVNVMSRYLQGGSKDTEAAVRATGGAVALCSATTIIGYSSLLMAENQALFLFGLLAVLGEITCLVAAVVALPSLLEWQERWQHGRTRTSP